MCVLLICVGCVHRGAIEETRMHIACMFVGVPHFWTLSCKMTRVLTIFPGALSLSRRRAQEVENAANSSEHRD